MDKTVKIKNTKMKFPSKKYNNIKIFLKDYTSFLNSTLNSIKIETLVKAATLIEKKIKQKKNIFLCGNGGSAAIANHYIADYLKTLKTETNLMPKLFSLSSNIELITAIANDISFDKVFSYQLKTLAQKGDLLIIISSSGNSKNIKNVLIEAKKIKTEIISFVGFTGGYAKKNSNISVHSKVDNYGISEDTAHIFMHIIVQFLKQKNVNKKIKKIKF